MKPFKKYINNLNKAYLLFLLLALFFVFINFIIAIQAYKVTHFKSINSNSLIKTPKPRNQTIDLDFIDVDTVKNNIDLEIWRFDMEPSKGVVALFHDYNTSKTSLWNEAQAFYRMGYTVILVDFRSAGKSDGFQSTLGYQEAIDVQNVFTYCKNQFPTKKIFLYGTSMGAVSIMRAVSELHLTPDGVLLQSPFSELLNIVKKKLEHTHIPSFGTAHLFTLWIGWLNNFNAFSLKPIEYAKNINCPTLLIYGMKDSLVSYSEIKEIYNQLPSSKELAFFSHSAHESILINEEPNWIYLVTNFMDSNHH